MNAPLRMTVAEAIRFIEVADALIQVLEAALREIVGDAWLCEDGKYLVNAKFIEAAEELV